MRDLKEDILDVLKQEVSPAIGSLELVSVVFCTAAATSVIGGWATRIDLQVSSEIYEAGKTDVIPELKVSGLEHAAALGTLLTNPDRKRMLMDEITEESIDMALRPEVLEHVRITVRDDVEPWFVFARVHTDWGIGTSEVSGRPDEAVLLQMAARKLWEKEPEQMELEAAQRESIRSADDKLLGSTVNELSEKELRFLQKGIEDTRLLLQEMKGSASVSEDLDAQIKEMERFIRKGYPFPYMTVGDSIRDGAEIYLLALRETDAGTEEEAVLRGIALRALQKLQ